LVGGGGEGGLEVAGDFEDWEDFAECIEGKDDDAEKVREMKAEMRFGIQMKGGCDDGSEWVVCE
jgi:hypothetical protein